MLVLRPVGDGGSWEWRWHPGNPDGTTGDALDDGPVTLPRGEDPDDLTALRADVPRRHFTDLVDGTDGDTPPLAARACGDRVDCGPGYQGTGGFDGLPEGRTDVDYLPDPAHLPMTVPSSCQTGAATGHARAAGSEDPRPGAGGNRQDPRGRVRRPAAVPDDPRYPTVDRDTTGQWNLARVGAPAAWDVTRGSGARRVAVIDAGLDAAHPDLAGRAVRARDFVPVRDPDVTSRRLPTDRDTDLGRDSHGTHVASLVGAATDDGAGMAGLGWETSLLVARVFDAEGCAADAAIVDAMAWAVERGAGVLNLSLGGVERAEELRRAGQDALAAGAVPVAAAGNSGSSVREYPASYPEYVSVAATGFMEPDDPEPDELAPYSTRNDAVELAAPGGTGSAEHAVLGACFAGPRSGRGFCRRSASSFSTPLVAAALALVEDVDAARTPAGRRQLLVDTARELRNSELELGRLDVGAALELLERREQTLRSVTTAADPAARAIAASRAAFPDGGAPRALLSRDDLFADALAGAALAGGDAPILLTSRTSLDGRVARELERVLAPDGRVLLLGGPVALDEQVGEQVADLGFDVERVWGQTRIQTANRIARRVGTHPSGRVLVASAANWPDAVAAGAYAAAHAVPLVLTRPDSAAPDRSPGLLDTIGALDPRDIVVLGGALAVRDRAVDDIEERFPDRVRRVFGPTRLGTAAAIARELWGRTTAGADDRYVLVHGWRSDGWASGLPASPLAARRQAPLLLHGDRAEGTQPSAYLRGDLGYRIERPASGVHVGPATRDGTGGTRTRQRLRELLGG